MRKFCILLVDDEERILNYLSSKFKAAGYDVLTAGNGLEALEQAQTHWVDLVVLDVVMPKMGGFEMLKNLRRFSNVPVIILSAKGADVDKIKGLNFGADDYLAKPFNPDELMARIKAVRRRFEAKEKRLAEESITLGDMVVDFPRRSIIIQDKDITLTRIEWLLICELAQNAGRIMLYEDLLTRIWGPEYVDDVQLLRTWMSRLRDKIERNSGQSRIIRTIAKTGYIIDVPSKP